MRTMVGKMLVKSAILLVVLPFAFGACARPEKFETARDSVKPGTEITWLGQKAPLFPKTGLDIGASLPELQLVNLRMKPEILKADGKVKLISTLPSLDTPVCDLQTHYLGETKELDPAVERITISADLPYAQDRFAEKAKLTNITYLSDYRTGEFGRGTGLRLQRNGLLARAILVVDGRGVIRYLQVVPEILKLPDMKRAIEAANALARSAGTQAS